jgi:thymidylate synthase (FAD)
MSVKLIWATPDADAVVGYCARVSNPANQDNPDVGKLLKYCADHHHFSVFEMASACIEITTTRDIGRQILRHKSFSFQEFSGRYQSYDKLPQAEFRECRVQDTKNRQNSFETTDQGLKNWWVNVQKEHLRNGLEFYEKALQMGIAKEQARALLPEGLTPSRMYMTGTLRSWLHYLQVRTDVSTQKEHRIIAQQALDALRPIAPITFNAFFGDQQ